MAARLSVSRIFRGHLLVILLLGCLNLLVMIGDARDNHLTAGLSHLFRLSSEGNVPNLFSALAIAAAALVAARVAQVPGLAAAERSGWRMLAILFAFMALDEAVQIHEGLSAVGHAYGAAGPWLNAGVFAYALVALFVIVWLFRFWLRQGRAVRAGFALGGIVYLVSAIGLEVRENVLMSAGVSHYDLRLGTLFTLEELGEMVAVALFLRTFLCRFAELGGGPLLALVGARPMLAIDIEPASELAHAPQPVKL